jgi:hypothetical protein
VVELDPETVRRTRFGVYLTLFEGSDSFGLVYAGFRCASP